MSKKKTADREKTGILLIVFGLFLLALSVFLLRFNEIGAKRLQDLLPAAETAAYLELPKTLDPRFANIIGKNFTVSWEADISPWLGEKTALALLRAGSRNGEEGPLFPVFLAQTQDKQKAFEFLKSFKNPAGDFKETMEKNIKRYSTPALDFVFFDEIAAASPSAPAIAALINFQAPSAFTLSRDPAFQRIYTNIKNDMFLFLRPQKLPDGLFALINEYTPKAPYLTLSFPAIGFSAKTASETVLQGQSYAVFDHDITLETEIAYNAALLPFLPKDIDILIAGENLSSQLKKISQFVARSRIKPPLAAGQNILPSMETLISLWEKNFFGGEQNGSLNTPQILAQIAPKEFAFAQTGGSFIFISEYPTQNGSAGLEVLRAAGKQTIAHLSPQTREVVLPDGSKAHELAPDPSAAREYQEKFEGIEIKGASAGQALGFYDSAAQGKLFFSNDLNLMKKTLLLTKEPGEQFRDSEHYKNSLQPILKNPDLLGFFKLPYGAFSFSKHTFAEHMETNWRLVLK